MVQKKKQREKSSRDLPIIGWREWVGLPELGIEKIKAKIDTGARSSSLHVYDVHHYEEEGVAFVRFKIHPLQRSSAEVVQAEARVLEFRAIRSSNSKVSVRPVIVTNIELLGETYAVELTLANRAEMGFRMLLGREAFRSRFLVDAGGSYYNGRPKSVRKVKKPKPRNE